MVSRMSGSRATRLAAAFGLVAVLAIPVAVAAAAYTTRVRLLPAVYVAVPVAFVVGLGAVAAYRRARAQLDRRVRRVGERPLRIARFLALAGLYVAVTGALALAFYGLLHLTA
jgi:hypothetical protein